MKVLNKKKPTHQIYSENPAFWGTWNPDVNLSFFTSFWEQTTSTEKLPSWLKSSPVLVLSLCTTSLGVWLFEDDKKSAPLVMLSKAKLPTWRQPVSPSENTNTFQIFLFSGRFDSASSGKTQLAPFSLLVLYWVVSLLSFFSWMRNYLLSPRTWNLPDIAFPVSAKPMTQSKCFLHNITQEWKGKT